MQATNLKTNHLTQPLGIDAGTLFLSWQCAEGVRQTAYEIEVTAGAETLWASGKALGSVMHTETPSAVPPKTQGRWRIRLWDENDQPVHGAPLPSRPGLHRQTGRACGSARRQKSRTSTALMPSTPLQSPTGSRSRRRWKLRQRQAQLISPTARQAICAKRSPPRREKASDCTLPLRDCMRHG